MTVSAPALVQAAAAARVALAEALVLKVGQVLEAIVLGKTAGGLTSLDIGGKLVEAKLPASLPVGTTLQLQVKTGGASPQLAIVSQKAPVGTPGQGPELAVARAAPTTVPPAARPVGIVESGQRFAGATLQNDSAAQPVVRAQPVPEAVVADGVPKQAAPVATVPARPVAVPEAQVAVEQTPGASAQPAVAGGRPAVATAPPVRAAAVPNSAAPNAAAPPAVVQTLPGSPAVVPVQTAEATAPVAPIVVPPTAAVSAVATAPRPATLAGLPAEGAPPHLASAAPASVAIVPTEVEPEAPNPLLAAQQAARPAASVADLPRSVAPAAVTVAPGSAPQVPNLPTTPQAALAQMMPQAMARQDSVAPLLMSLAALVQKPEVLPQPVLRAALAVLAQRIVATGGRIAATDLAAGVAKSGVFLEAALAQQAPVAGDMKAALLGLKATLGRMLGETPAPPVVRDSAPPPLKGLPLRAVPVEPLPLPETAHDAARLVHGQADAAISRVKLMQLASLPDDAGARPAAPTLRLDLPFLIGHELVMAQIQIAQDGARQEAQRKRGWTMRFALHFSATGEVGAEVGLLGKSVSVALWAVEPETAEAFEASLPELRAALENIGLEPGAIRLRARPDDKRSGSGQLLDRGS